MNTGHSRTGLGYLRPAWSGPPGSSGGLAVPPLEPFGMKRLILRQLNPSYSIPPIPGKLSDRLSSLMQTLVASPDFFRSMLCHGPGYGHATAQLDAKSSMEVCMHRSRALAPLVIRSLRPGLGVVARRNSDETCHGVLKPTR